jgi:tRNA A-37 threonylcarbamoyl transferase component Bud32
LSRNALRRTSGIRADSAPVPARQTGPVAPTRNEEVAINDDCKTPGRPELAGLLREQFARTGDGSGLHVEGPVRIGRYSIIYRAALPGRSDMAVKCCIDPATGHADADAAASQYSALERVWQRMTGDPSLRVPRPLFLLRRHGVVAMEWIPGDTVTARLLSWTTRRDEALRLVARSAEWLRSFHAAGRSTDRILDVEDKYAGLSKLEQSVLQRQPSARAAFAALRLHGSAAAAQPLGQSWQHGDYKTDNLLVSGDAIIGIDAHVRSVNAMVYDAASFINHLELTVYHPRALRVLGLRTQLVRKFLETFDPSYLGAHRLAYLWTSLYLMLWNWHEFTGRDVGSMAHRYMRVVFHVSVRRLTNALIGRTRSAH